MAQKMAYEELDQTTRRFMLQEFEAEERQRPYRSKGLTESGLQAFPELMRQAISSGDEATLTASLANPGFWHSLETYTRNGKTSERRVNTQQAAERLALTEFNTWYVRGLGRRLESEGVQQAQVYRAAEPKWEVAGCSEHEGRIVTVKEILDGHRARYWPEPGNQAAFSIPYAPGCHHAIRRLRPT